MTISPQQQYTDYGLLVPRNTIRFRGLIGMPGVKVEPVSGIETKVKPVVITAGEDYDFEGVASGGRSGLLIVDGSTLKVEGSNIEQALRKKGDYRTDNRGTPEGGYIRSIAEKRIQAILRINEKLTNNEFPVAYKPEAIIYYGKEFGYSPYGIWRHVAKLFGHNLDTISDELAAPVMSIKGDTRVSEFYRLKPRNTKAAQQVAHILGLMAGAQNKIIGAKKRTTITSSSKFSRMARNYVVFLEGDRIYLAMVGNEDTFLHRNVKSGAEDYSGLTRDLTQLISLALGGDDGEDSDEEPEEEQEGELEKQGEEMISGVFKRHPYHSKSFRVQFERGFESGYKNPDKREPITLEMLVEAFDLQLPISN